jgi:hypothetical protein
VSGASCGLQAVIKVPSREGRLAYLRKAFTSDWEGAAPVRAGSARSAVHL